MSYILDALKKAEREREMAQFIDYNNRQDQNQNKWLVLPKIRAMPWMSIILAMNVLLLILLFWPKAPPVAPQVYIVSPNVGWVSE